MHTQTTIEQFQKQVADLTRERDAYKASSEEYCAVLDASMDAVIFTATGGRIFHANRAACDLFQMTETELVADGRAYLNADNDEVLARVLQKLRETRRFQGVINHRKKDGTVFPGEVSSVLFASANGEERSCTIIRDRSAEMQVSKEREEAVQKYTTLLESFPLGVTISDEDGDIIETNAAAEQLLGLGREEHETRSLSGRQWQIIRPDGTPMPSEEWASVIALKERRRVENCVLGVIRPDAKVIWLNVMATALPIAGFGVIVTYSDVTEKKCGEEYLEKYKNIVSSTQDGIAFVDDEYRYRIVNDAYERFSGVKKETFIGLSIAEYLGENVFQEVIQPQFDKCMQGETIHYQQWFDYPSLGRRFVDVTYVPYKDANNRITGVVATTRDNTAQRLVEEELARTTEQLELTGEMAKIGGWELDLKSNKMIFSRTARLINEVDPNVELSLADAFAMIDADDRAAHQVAVESSLISGVPWDRELRMTTAKGRPIWVRIQGVPVMENGRVVKLNGTFQDITEKNQAEEEKKKLLAQLHQAQKMEAIGTLAGGIAHDFNNILGAIVGYSEMIRDDFPPGAPGIHDINQVLKASHRAKDLVKQILAFSRQVEDRKIPMQPAGIVKEAINLLRSSLPTTITIQQNIDPDAGMVLGDPTQIHQVVMNLATNAFHAMEAKGGTLTISVEKKILSRDDLAIEPDLQPGTFVQLSVRDTGEGILPEIRERIFDPFFTTKEVGKGTGLGLSMVYSIVKSCNGAIVCESRPGQGTEFRILLPTLEGQAVQASEATDVTPYGKEHILLIDDEEMLIELGQAMLKRLGYHVTTRTNSLDALMTFQNQPNQFDLIITDQTMPGMTGVDLARRILQIRPQMPIILCTGYSSQISEDKAKVAGIRGFAYKPLAKKEIGELIRKVLDEKNL